MKESALLVPLFALVLGVSCQSVETSPEKKADDSAAPVNAPANWNGSMKELRKTLTELEPYLFDTVRYEYPANRELIRGKLEKLADISAKVNHDPTVVVRDPTVKFVASQFAKHLRRATEQFNDGRRMYARYEVISVTRFCVECHTRMPGGPQNMLDRSQPFLREMPTIDRAEYLISARDFDAAYDLLLGTLEHAGATTPPGMAYDRVAKLALQIAVQFKQSTRLTRDVIKTITENPNLPYYLKERARGWKRSLEEWEKEKPTPETLWSLRKMVEDRATDIEALRALPRVLARLSAHPDSTENAELLSLAGQCYEAIDEISSLGLGQNYYEACIRAQPHSAVARGCYTRLEGSISAGYTGTGGTRVPGDVQSELRALKELAN